MFKEEPVNGGEPRVVAKHVLQGFYKFGGQARDEDSHIGSDGLYQQVNLAWRHMYRWPGFMDCIWK